jgi:hypothetical protein
VTQAYQVGGDWTENGVTWDSAPVPLENISRTEFNWCAEGEDCRGVRSVDVTGIVRRGGDSALLYTAAGQYHSGRYIYTREGGVKPVLRVAYTMGGQATATPVPPTTAPTSTPTNTPPPTATATATMTPQPPTTAPTSTPSPTPTPETLAGIAILGDSFYDEYRGTDNRGGAYAATTYNAVELLARLRGLDFGAWGARAEPRRTGYEYVWARSGATSRTMIEQGQHTGAAAQIAAGDVSHVWIGIGANDFSPYYLDGYRAIYDGRMTDAQVTAKVEQAVADVTTAVDTVLAAGADGVVVTLFNQWANDPQLPALYPNAAGRARVTAAIDRVNAGLAQMAASRGVVLFDQNAWGVTEVAPLIDAQGNLYVGGEPITFVTNGDEPHHSRLADAEHVGTVMSGVVANGYFVEQFNRAFGLGIVPLTEAETLAAAGIGTAPTVTPTVTPTSTPQATPGPVAGCTRTVQPGGLRTAVTALQPGEVLCLADGVYTESISPARSGQAGRPITVRAVNDGKAILDGEGQRRVIYLGLDWWAIEGLVARNGWGDVMRIDGDNNTVRRVSFYNADTDVNSTVVFVNGDDNLLEDVVAAGSGRWGVEIYEGNRNTLRRVFVKWESWDGRNFCGVSFPNGFAAGVYNGSNNIMENVIAYGRAVTGIMVQANHDVAVADNNSVLGSMALFMGRDYDGSAWTYGTGQAQPTSRPGPTDCPNNITQWDWGGQRVGFLLFGQGTLRNNVFRDVLAAGNMGVGFSAMQPYSAGPKSGNVLERARLVGNGEGAAGWESAQGGQIYNGLGVQVLPGAPVLGARYVNRTLTTQPLLPWPMEARIQAELGISATAIWTQAMEGTQ